MREALVSLISLIVAALTFISVSALASRYLTGGENRHHRYNWSQSRGHITSSRVFIKGRDEPPSWYVSNFFKVRPHWEIAVKFTSDADGVDTVREQRWYTDSNDKAGAQDERLQYLPGNSVTVYYDDEKPGRAVIEPTKPTKHDSDVKFAAESVGSVLGGLGTWIFAWRIGWL